MTSSMWKRLGCAAAIAPWFFIAACAQDAPKHGTVLFSAGEDAPPAVRKAAADAPLPEVTAAERNAVVFTAYDLGVHLTPAEGRIAVHSRLKVRNDGAAPLEHLALELSSSLSWESVAIVDGGKAVPAAFGQHLVETDIDHTGKVSEAVVTLARPLAPGATVELTAFYSGEIKASAERLERIGAPADKAAEADWDEISPEWTGLRGFGDVLWYPAAGEPVFLGDGAKLFQAVGRNKLRQAEAKVRLRLSVQFVGDAPDAAFFCGRREHLSAVREDENLPVAESPGVATAEFEAQPMGFRSLDLFVTDRAPTVTDDTLIAAVTERYDAVPQYAAAAALVKPLLTEWLGATPLGQLTVIDHDGQPFEDDALLVLPVRAVASKTLAPSLVHSLAHAWFRSSRPWLDEGVPQFLSLVWTEKTQGRELALQRLQDGANTLALAEPENLAAGQSLTGASDEVYYRTKAVAVLWMLRAVAGDEPLKKALQAYRGAADESPEGFEKTLEGFAHKDLRWFFDDWVYRDRGLPDLSIVNVASRQMAGKSGASAGWLVAVEVKNDGDAAAEVPVTVRSGTLTATDRLRVPGRSSVSTRILFQGLPEEVLVNDGTVPEMRVATHVKKLREVADPAADTAPPHPPM